MCSGFESRAAHWRGVTTRRSPAPRFSTVSRRADLASFRDGGGPQGPSSIPKGVLKAPLLRSFEPGDGRSRKIGVHPEEEELQLPVRDLKSHHDLVARRHVLMCRIADGCVSGREQLGAVDRHAGIDRSTGEIRCRHSKNLARRGRRVPWVDRGAEACSLSGGMLQGVVDLPRPCGGPNTECQEEQDRQDQGGLYQSCPTLFPESSEGQGATNLTPAFTGIDDPSGWNASPVLHLASGPNQTMSVSMASRSTSALWAGSRM